MAISSFEMQSCYKKYVVNVTLISVNKVLAFKIVIFYKSWKIYCIVDELEFKFVELISTSGKVETT